MTPINKQLFIATKKKVTIRNFSFDRLNKKNSLAIIQAKKLYLPLFTNITMTLHSKLIKHSFQLELTRFRMPILLKISNILLFTHQYMT